MVRVFGGRVHHDGFSGRVCEGLDIPIIIIKWQWC